MLHTGAGSLFVASVSDTGARGGVDARSSILGVQPKKCPKIMTLQAATVVHNYTVLMEHVPQVSLQDCVREVLSHRGQRLVEQRLEVPSTVSRTRSRAAMVDKLVEAPATRSGKLEKQRSPLPSASKKFVDIPAPPSMVGSGTSSCSSVRTFLQQDTVRKSPMRFHRP